MDTINFLIDGSSASLDEVIALIDSYNFDVVKTNEEFNDDNATGFLMDTEIETILIGEPDDLGELSPNNTTQNCKADKIQSRGLQSITTTHPKHSQRDSLPELRWPITSSTERGRVRERVIRLRGVVKQLEQHLEILTHRNDQTFGLSDDPQSKEDSKVSVPNKNTNSTANGVVPPTRDDEDIRVWRHLATRHYAARRKAEKENVNLRERLEEQIRVAKRLEHFIRNQLPDQTPDSMNLIEGPTERENASI